jgi:hypothetical protein
LFPGTIQQKVLDRLGSPLTTLNPANEKKRAARAVSATGLNLRFKTRFIATHAPPKIEKSEFHPRPRGVARIVSQVTSLPLPAPISRIFSINSMAIFFSPGEAMPLAETCIPTCFPLSTISMVIFIRLLPSLRLELKDAFAGLETARKQTAFNSAFPFAFAAIHIRVTHDRN